MLASHLFYILVRYEGLGLAFGTVPGTQLSQQSCQTKIPSGPEDTSSVLRSRVTGAGGYSARTAKRYQSKDTWPAALARYPAPKQGIVDRNKITAGRVPR